MSAISVTTAGPADRGLGEKSWGPIALCAVFFVVLFAKPAQLLALDWWNDPEAGHGLLLAPVAIWLAWQKGLLPNRQGNPGLGLAIIVSAVVVRVLSELAAELFTMRISMVGAGVGLVVFAAGVRQALAWWLPSLLLGLSVPLPDLIISSIALPLQFKASQMGAALLEWRGVPVQLTGNVILLPGHRLFVTEACSGLRSLTALLALGVLIGGLWLRRPVTRILLLAVAIPIAIAINGVRVFLTGFLVFFVDPKLGDGFMHMTEGWLLFLVSFVMVSLTAWLIRTAENKVVRRLNDTR